MTTDLRQHFKSQVEGRTARARVRHILEPQLSTPIGRILLTAFAKSGTFTYQTRFPDNKARAMYIEANKTLALTARATPTDGIHELAHFRQALVLPDINSFLCTPLSRGQTSIIQEADSWAIGTIFMKQFFAAHRDNLDTLERFLAREKDNFAHSVNVAPVFLPDGTYVSLLESRFTAAYTYLRAKQADPSLHDPAQEALIADIANPNTDATWAAEIFKASFDNLGWEHSNMIGYGAQGILDSYEIIIELALQEFPIEKLEWPEYTEDDYTHMVLRLANLRDVGVNGIYIARENFSDLRWCTQPSAALNDFYQEARRESLQGIGVDPAPR